MHVPMSRHTVPMAGTSHDYARLARQAQGKLWRARRFKARERLNDAAASGDVAALGALAPLGDPPGRWAAEMWHRRLGLAEPQGYSQLAEALTAIMLDAGPRTLTSAMRVGVVAAAAVRDHPVGHAARNKIVANADPDLISEVCRAACSDVGLAAFCAEQGFEPRDAVDAARFSALTDRDRHRALDPDGSLLARAYGSSHAAERDLIRAAAVEWGDQGLLRRLIDAELPVLHSRETADPRAADLAALGDWPTLWRLASRLSTLDMVGLTASIPQGWTPQGDPDRRIHAAARALRDVPPPYEADVVTIVSRRRSGIVRNFHRVSTAANGTQIAVIDGHVTPANPLPDLSVVVFAAGDHDPVVTYPHDSAMPAHDQLLHLSGDVTLAGSWRQLTLYSGGATTLLDEHVYALVATPDGGYAALTANHLVLGNATGRLVKKVQRSRLKLPESTLMNGYLAVDIDGTLAVAAQDTVVVDPTGRRPRRIVVDGTISALAFDGEHIAVAAQDHGGVRALRQVDPSGAIAPYPVPELPSDPRHVMYSDVSLPITRLDSLPGLGSLLFTEGPNCDVSATAVVVGGAPLDPVLVDPDRQYTHVLSVEAGRYLAIGRAVTRHRSMGSELIVHDLHRTVAQQLLSLPMDELLDADSALLDPPPLDPWLALLRARLALT